MLGKQLEAFEKFSKLKVGACFMETGTGKTKVAIDIINYNAEKVDLVIYVAPFSAIDNIKAEFEKFRCKVDVFFIGFESISQSDKKYLNTLKLIEGKRVFVVADESTFIKNDATKRFNRLCDIRNKSDYALILNGTPITKNEWDIYNQMYFLSPLIFKMNRNEFHSVFFKEIKYKKKGEQAKKMYKFSEVNEGYFKKIIAPYTFECALDFDNDVEETTTLVPSDLKSYEQIKNDILKEIDSGCSDASSVIVMINTLLMESTLSEAKNKKVIEEAKGKQVIVYCSFLKEMAMIEEGLDCYVINGAVKKEERTKIIEQFKNDTKPLLITFGTGSFSLNLQFCNKIIYSSLPFNYGLVKQSRGRIKRYKQSRNISYRHILTDCGVTQLVIDNLAKKERLSDLIKQEIAEGSLKEWAEKSL
jgi:SNF2 family DNA or RNA helicase